MTTQRIWMATVMLGAIVSACLEEPSTSNSPTATGSAAPRDPTGNPDLSTTSISAVLAGAGDIAGCSSGYGDAATAKLVLGISGTVATFGDNAYPDGTSTNYKECYHPTWGQFKGRTKPAPGNHDYEVSSSAAGYFGYFGSLAGPCCRGYYVYSLAGWRLYSLNSEANLRSQLSWLRSDLANHLVKCVLAYWHRPLYTGGHHSPATRMHDTFKALYRAGAELVLNGHDHNYQRFARMDADGNKRTNGVREFVVGTGGAKLYAFEHSAPNLQVKYNRTHGILRLTLSSGSYSWRFIPTSGSFSDSGSESCH